MNRAPDTDHGEIEGPTRSAGITPASQLDPDAFVPGE
jgi:hypothetical protein